VSATYLRTLGWVTKHGLRQWIHVTGARAVRANSGLWRGVRLDGSAKVFPARQQAMTWAVEA